MAIRRSQQLFIRQFLPRSVGSRYYMGYMSTVATLQIVSSDSKTTEQIAERFGQKLKGGEVIELISDLGGGKTTFTRGLVRGAGSNDHVSSPTFKISNTYRAPEFDILHYDFYRLQEPGLMSHELAEAFADPHNVCVVEWGEVVAHVLPADRVSITIKALSENERKLSFVIPASKNYLSEGLA